MAGKIKTLKQLLTLKLIIEKAYKLAQNHPEIADLYRNGQTAGEIAAKYFKDGMDINPDIARKCVLHAFRGYTGRYNNKAFKVIDEEGLHGEKGGIIITRIYHKPYAGLLSPEERAFLAYEHKVQNGLNLRDKKKGFFGASDEQRTEWNKSAAKKAGEYNRENRIGYCGLTKRQCRENGENGAIARGYILYSAEETTRFLELLREHDKYVTYKAISITLNQEFHGGRNVRNPRSIASFKFGLKKLLK